LDDFLDLVVAARRLAAVAHLFQCVLGADRFDLVIVVVAGVVDFLELAGTFHFGRLGFGRPGRGRLGVGGYRQAFGDLVDLDLGGDRFRVAFGVVVGLLAICGSFGFHNLGYSLGLGLYDRPGCVVVGLSGRFRRLLFGGTGKRFGRLH